MLAGIARHGRPKGPMEPLRAVDVTVEGGVTGDFRGAIKPGSRGRRQVTVLTSEGLDAAFALLGQSIDWWRTRRNLLVTGIELPRREGAIIRVGADVALRVTGECDPCRRMNEVIDGLHEAMMPDWRGGVTTKVISGGHIAIGDAVRIEE